MHFNKLFIGAALFALGTGLAFAQDTKQREPLMKDIGRAFSDLNKMNRGQSPYDGAAAAAAFAKISATAPQFGALFAGAPSPEGRSLPAIWEHKADFDARVAKLAADAHAGAAAAAKGETEFKAAFAALGGNCSGCHEKYRGD